MRALPGAPRVSEGEGSTRETGGGSVGFAMTVASVEDDFFSQLAPPSSILSSSLFFFFFGLFLPSRSCVGFLLAITDGNSRGTTPHVYVDADNAENHGWHERHDGLDDKCVTGVFIGIPDPFFLSQPEEDPYYRLHMDG